MSAPQRQGGEEAALPRWLWALFDREHRALHDHLAGTYVIVDED